MRLMCAWCQQEGAPAFLCEVEPLDDETETHGICARHRFEVLQELDTAQARPATVGGGVQPSAPEVVDEYEMLHRWIADSGEMLDTLMPGVLAAGSRLAHRAETAERANRSLEARLATLQRDVAELQRERQHLNNLHTEV